MRTVLNQVILFLAISAFSVMSQAAGVDSGGLQLANAITIQIYGIGPGVDGRAYQQVRNILGKNVANGVIDQFHTSDFGIEGGATFCVEINQGHAWDILKLEQSLNKVKPDPRTTAYSVVLGDGCISN